MLARLRLLLARLRLAVGTGLGLLARLRLLLARLRLAVGAGLGFLVGSLRLHLKPLPLLFGQLEILPRIAIPEPQALLRAALFQLQRRTPYRQRAVGTLLPRQLHVVSVHQCEPMQPPAVVLAIRVH